MTHFVKNLGDKLVDVHSVGQNKVCAENNRHLTKSSKTNIYIYLQHLTTAHCVCSTAAAVGVGHENWNNILYIYTHPLILQIGSFLFENVV